MSLPMMLPPLSSPHNLSFYLSIYLGYQLGRDGSRCSHSGTGAGAGAEIHPEDISAEPGLAAAARGQHLLHFRRHVLRPREPRGEDSCAAARAEAGRGGARRQHRPIRAGGPGWTYLLNTFHAAFNTLRSLLLACLRRSRLCSAARGAAERASPSSPLKSRCR